MSTAIPASYIKSIVFLAVSAFLALFSGYWLSLLRVAPEPRMFFFAGLGVILWLMIGMLRPYVFWNAKYAALSILLDTLLFIIPVAVGAGGTSRGIVLAWVLLLFFSIASFMDGKEELRSVMHIRFMKVGRGAARYLVLGANLFLAIVIVLQLMTNGVSISKPLLGILLQGTVPAISRTIPGFSLEMSAETFLEELARSRAPAGTPHTLISDLRDRLAASVEESAHIVLDPQKSVIDAVHEGLTGKLGNLTPRQQSLTFFVVAGLIFFVLSGVAFVVRGIILLLGSLLYQVLLAFNFFRIKLETHNKEVVEI